jgi:hypothetical protein
MVIATKPTCLPAILILRCTVSLIETNDSTSEALYLRLSSALFCTSESFMYVPLSLWLGLVTQAI